MPLRAGILYLSEDICESNFMNLAFLDGVEGFNLVFRDDYISIYEL